MPVPLPAEETRTLAQLAQQFLVEQELAERLARAPDTRGMYSSVYEEFLARVPHLPVLTGRGDSELLRLQLQLLRPFLSPVTRFLEIGSGDSALALHLAAELHQVYAVEATAAVLVARDPPKNFELLVTDSTPYPLPDASIDLAFSCHFIEHVRPDDALRHVEEVYRLLAPGGRYVCVTPNRLWGPHDVSKYFVDAPRGLHLREYSHGDLIALLRSGGFHSPTILGRGGRALPPLAHIAALMLEGAVAPLPARARRRVLGAVGGRGAAPPLRRLEQVQVSVQR